jgi:hypothetical protein
MDAHCIVDSSSMLHALQIFVSMCDGAYIFWLVQLVQKWQAHKSTGE